MTTTTMAMWVYQIPQQGECPCFAQFIIPQNVEGKKLVGTYHETETS